MKIVFVSTMLGAPWGGSEELWSQAAIRFRQAGDEVLAFVPYRRRLSDKLSVLSRQGITVRTYPSPTSVAGWFGHVRNRLTLRFRRIHAKLRRFSPDLVVISQGEIADGLEWSRVCREAGIAYVQLVHCNGESFWFRKNDIIDAVASYTGARRVFCVSRGNLRLLQLQLGAVLANSEIAWNPCNVSSDSNPPWPDRSSVLKIACVGRLEPAAKGQDLLLQVLARPEWRDRPVEVSFFGEGSHELALRRMTEMLQLRNVQFRGHVNDVQAIWEEHHILALPSRFEGLPLVLVEAMRCGRPAIVTDVAGNAELCADGQTGFVAESASLTSFAKAMESAWQARSEWKQMGEAARHRVGILMPQDPVGVFCERLRTCAVSAPQSAQADIRAIQNASGEFLNR